MGEKCKINVMEMEAKLQSSFLLFSNIKNKINSENVHWLKDAQKFSNELLKVYLMTNENKIYVK